MQVQAYMNFDGRCEEALEFYRKALDGEITALMRFSDSPEPAPPGMVPPGTERKIMHSTIKIGDSTLMASDCHCTGKVKFEGMSLALSPKTVADGEKYFNALADGGQVVMPLGKTFWSPAFGVVNDRFGVSWMVSVQE